MAKHEESALENGKVSRGAPAPVIRKLVVAEEDSTTRLLHSQVPAWVISGLIHVVLVVVFYYFMKWTDKQEKELEAKEPAISTNIDDKPEKEIDLTNPDPGLDSELERAVQLDTDPADFNVTAPVIENEAKGLDNQEKDFAPNTAIQGFSPSADPSGSTNDPSNDGNIAPGLPGGGSQLALPGLRGRSGETKAILLKNDGGNEKTELAVALALVWLAKQQNTGGGYWEFDGTHKADRVAATGMCLLPFLAAGETHKSGKKYRETVFRGINYLKSQIKPNGQMSQSMYSQAIATVALCEAAGMTRDDTVKKEAAKAVKYIIESQAQDGSWGYTANTQGDTSIVGWQIQALKSAKLADIPVTPKAFEQATNFLESVSGDSGATYGYRTKGSTHTLTAVALLCRQYMGWTPRNASLARGIDFMWDKYPPREDDWNMYYYYYATQVVHFFNGQKWKDWNAKMQKILLDKQVTQASPPDAKAADYGSWPKDNGSIGAACGKLGTTALACLTLEVYYRHLPLYKRDNGAAAD